MSDLEISEKEQRILTEKINLTKLYLGTAIESEKYYRERLEALEIDAEDLRVKINEQIEEEKAIKEITGD
jgi:hypothetical protein